jgi:hypothetical protein
LEPDTELELRTGGGAMKKDLACCRTYCGLSLFLIGIISARQVDAQLAGTFHSAPGTTATYEYHSNGFSVAILPVDVTFEFSNDNPTSMLTAIIHKPIIGVLPIGQPPFPSGLQFPMVVTGTSYNGRDFSGDLLGTQYMFDWTIIPAANDELLWNGKVGWTGGRYELTTITDARLIPGLAGDFNQDGAVNAADYVVWRKDLGTTYTQNDYNVWRAHFGQTSGSGTGASVNAAVPEPASALLLAFSAAVRILVRLRAD